MIVDWVAVSVLVGLLGDVALVASALLVLSQLRKQSEEQFVSGTAVTFAIWMDDDFQRAVQWVLYDLSEENWRGFVAARRNEYGERALQRVGGYFNRVGYLVTHHLIGSNDVLLLDTIAPSAIAVWQKIERLVLEARLIENSTLSRITRGMLPRCYECYVPSMPIPARGRHADDPSPRPPGQCRLPAKDGPDPGGLGSSRAPRQRIDWLV